MEHILIVDDEASVLKYLTKMLAAEGYSVHSADTGEMALASVAERRPDLILVDVNMPVMDGFEVCRHLKRQKATAAIPVIFISGSMETTNLANSLALGAVDFVIKPFQREELVARVRTHVELSRLRGDLEAEVVLRTAELREALVRLQHEIADRTRVEEALRESEERFRNMANTAPVLIWVSGPDKLCTFFNTSWLTFTGRTIDQELGYGWAENVHPDDIQQCLDLYTSSFDARRRFRTEYRLRRSDGEYRWVLDEGVPRLEPGGGFAGYVGSCIDITDTRRAQEESLGRARIESLRVLAGGVAHDFTNLMGGIFTTAELAEHEFAGHSSVEYFRRIRTVAQRAVEIARELMIYAGRDKGYFELLDVSQVVQDIAELLMTSISKRTVMRMDLSKDLPAIWGNPTHIRQVVMNLIINASEAIGDTAGVIHIRTSHAPDAHRKDSGDSGGGVEWVRLEISDTGQGMTDEHRARIFDPFFTTKDTGHGLGLSVVQGILHSHRGLIHVTSAPGSGTTFDILLPCAANYAGDGMRLSQSCE
jgi:PAS domain S-box-containing protein